MMTDELLNIIADTHNGKMHKDTHALEGNNTVFYFRDAIREALTRVSLPIPPPAEISHFHAALADTQRALVASRAERARDIGAYQRLCEKVGEMRRALDASTIAHNRMRSALFEAQEELGCGQLLNAQAAIKRGLAE